MAKAWLVDSRGIAKKVKNAVFPSALQIKDCGANRECPNCHCRIDNTDVSSEWPGLPAGVKFDPSDAELLEHLAEKCGNGKQHMLIDEFIPTLEGKGIYSDHPENLPGAKKDGSSVHFFHKTMNAYATGQRKRRKVHNQCCSTAEDVRWHKTGKTKAVVENGVLKGFKKIMVLYRSSKKGSKPNKANWVMHQYHLGTEEDEKEGEYVVSKILFQQQKQTDKNDESLLVDDSNKVVLRTSPRTPNTNPPVPPRPGKSDICPHVTDDDMLQSPKTLQGAEPIQGGFHRADSDAHFEDDVGYTAWLTGESQAVESSHLDCIDDSLLCNEILDAGFSYQTSANNISKINELTGNNISSSGIADLENLELDSPPDFQDLQFCSQESVLDWLDRL